MIRCGCSCSSHPTDQPVTTPTNPYRSSPNARGTQLSAACVTQGVNDKVAERVMEWVHAQRRHAQQVEVKWWQPPQVTLLDWPSNDSLLHLSAVHLRWRTLCKMMDQINLQFDLQDKTNQAKCCAILMKENTDGTTLLGLLLEDPDGGDELAQVWNRMGQLTKPLRGFTTPRWLVAKITDEQHVKWPVATLLELLGDAALRPQGFEGFSLQGGKQFQLRTKNNKVELPRVGLRPEEAIVIAGFMRGWYPLPTPTPRLGVLRRWPYFGSAQ